MPALTSKVSTRALYVAASERAAWSCDTRLAKLLDLCSESGRVPAPPSDPDRITRGVTALLFGGPVWSDGQGESAAPA